MEDGRTERRSKKAFWIAVLLVVGGTAAGLYFVGSREGGKSVKRPGISRDYKSLRKALKAKQIPSDKIMIPLEGAIPWKMTESLAHSKGEDGIRAKKLRDGLIRLMAQKSVRLGGDIYRSRSPLNRPPGAG